MTLMSSTMIFLAAAVVAVPVFKKLRLGAILGYLVAGMVIGPSLFNWVDDPETILHFAELGVVLLLFIIGLELDPTRIWRMRDHILFTGGGQLVLTSVVISTLCFILLDISWLQSIIIGLALALSSTAFAIQLMNEQNILRTPPGQKGFAILLMQDMAVIPILLLVESTSSHAYTEAPDWWLSIFMIAIVLVVGRYLLNPFLRLISRYGSTEIMTAAALLIVMATALGLQQAGLSMGMGAFIAGILLANSSFKHQLETEIEPFKGLLLGLFFMAIGMNLDLSLLISKPVFIITASLLLVLIKLLIIYAIMRLNQQANTDAMQIGLMLSQGGEFAFVIMAQAASNGVLSEALANEVTLLVGISMALTSPLVILHSMLQGHRNFSPSYDHTRDINEPQVIIAGFGRFGQITARILHANQIPFTALDKDADHIEFVKQFGSKIFYGDASRLDLLEKAGIATARVLLICVGKEEDGLKIAMMIRKKYPHIKIIARTRNRLTAMKYAEIGVSNYIREVFAGSLEAAELVLREYGFSSAEAQNMIQVFADHDIAILNQAIDEKMDMQQLIDVSKQNRKELEEIFARDDADIVVHKN